MSLCAVVLRGLLIAALAEPVSAPEPIPVRYPEGVLHGFLVVKTLGGETIADGDMSQSVQGDRVESRTVFRFRDGSIQDETTVFSQSGRLWLVSDHLVQRGPSFPEAVDVSIDGKTGQVSIRRRDKSDKETVAEKRLDLPADVANGIVLTLAKNLPAADGEKTVSIVTAGGSPGLARLTISRAGAERFAVGRWPHKAVRYRIRLAGPKGLLARLISKKPVDTNVWFLDAAAPVFVKSEGPLYFGGPVWRVELTSPTWPQEETAADASR